MFLLLLSTLAFADDKIVVTATRDEAAAADLPFSVGRVDGERWSALGQTPETALSTVPGVSFTASGGPSQTRSVLIRGAKAEHTLVLVDGIPVNDPLSPSRAFDFGSVPASEIDRVEVIKGPQSVLYGSDAMGGVVQIFTKRSGTRARLEGGSYATKRAGLSAHGFRAGYFDTKGFSSADERDGNREADKAEAWNVGGTKELAIGDHLLVRGTAQLADNKVDTDFNGGKGGDSFNTYARHRQLLLREENVVFLPGAAELTVAGSYAGHDREDNTNGGDFYRSKLWKAETVARKPLGAQTFTLGGEYGEESGISSQTLGGDRKFRTGAVFLQDQLKLGRFHAVGGGRLDWHSETETAATVRLGLGYWILPETLRAKGSVGTGFKAPSLYQTYSRFGATNLPPEKSVGGDLGLELQGDDWKTDLTAFANSFKYLIDFNLITNKYFSQKRAETYGLEWGAERRFGLFRAGNAATILRTRDPDTGLRLLRRPLWSDTLTVGVGRENRFGLDLLGRYVGEREDAHPVFFTRQPMPAFVTFGLDGFLTVAQGWRVVGRAENLLDRYYQETSGYGEPGLSGYFGMEAEL